MRALFALTMLAAAVAGCSSSSDDAGTNVATDDAIEAAGATVPAEEEPPASADEVPDDWACARRNTFTPVGQSPDMKLVDESDMHTEPTAEAFAEDTLQYFDGPVRWVTAELDDDDGTFVYANADDEVVGELVVARRGDGWVEIQDTVCA